MNKNTFFVIEEIEEATGKSFSYAQKVSNSNNLKGFFRPSFHGYNILSINACDTWKEAQDIANAWNECAKEKGKYIFQ